MLAICRWTATCKLRPWTTLSVFDWNTAVLRRCPARMDGFRPIVFCEKRWHRVKMHCQTPAVQDPWFPGIAVTVLLGVHGKSDVAGNNTRALDCFWQAVKHCQQRRQEWGGVVVEAQLRQESNQWESQSCYFCFLLLDMTMKKETIKKKRLPSTGHLPPLMCHCEAEQCRVLLCCSWWQSLIMCSTKQELGLQSRVAV